MARKAPDQDAGEALRRFKSDLKAGTLGNFYIISGEEAFLRSHYVDLITKKIADGPAGSTATASPPTTARPRPWPTPSTPCR